MTQNALRLARQNVGLREFTLRLVGGWDHEDQLNGNYRLWQTGEYLVLPAAVAGMWQLRAREAGVGALGRYSRTSTREILPLPLT